MKVQDLLEYYEPSYDENRKILVGSVKEWLVKFGATKADVKAAVEQAMQLPSYEPLKPFDKSSNREQVNGTFAFKKPGPKGVTDETYLVYANGQIRSSAKSSWWNGNKAPAHLMTRLKSPKPPVENEVPKLLVTIYDNAFKELSAKIKKRLKDKPNEVR